MANLGERYYVENFMLLHTDNIIDLAERLELPEPQYYDSVGSIVDSFFNKIIDRIESLEQSREKDEQKTTV